MEDSRIEDLHWPDREEHDRPQRRAARRRTRASGAYSLTLGDHSRIEMPDG